MVVNLQGILKLWREEDDEPEPNFDDSFSKDRIKAMKHGSPQSKN